MIEKNKEKKYPLKDEHGKLIWKNLFRMGWTNFFFFVILLYLVWAYNHDIQACNEVIQDPGSFCNLWCEEKKLRDMQQLFKENTENIDIDFLEQGVKITDRD